MDAKLMASINKTEQENTSNGNFNNSSSRLLISWM